MQDGTVVSTNDFGAATDSGLSLLSQLFSVHARIPGTLWIERGPAGNRSDPALPAVCARGL